MPIPDVAHPSPYPKLRFEPRTRPRTFRNAPRSGRIQPLSQLAVTPVQPAVASEGVGISPRHVRKPPIRNPKEDVFMVRKLSLLVGLVLLASLTAHAQDASDKVELFGGYSYMRTDSPI